MSSRVDQEFTRVMEAVSAAARPAPRLDPETQYQRKSRRPVVAVVSAFVAVMVTLGLGAVLASSMRSSDATREPAVATDYPIGSVEFYWERMTIGAEPIEPFFTSVHRSGQPDVVAVTQKGPRPRFNPAELGEVQRIRSYAEFPFTGDAHFNESFPLVESEFIPPVAFIGTLEGTSTQVLLYRAVHVSSGEMTLCLDEQNNGARGIQCSSRDERANDGFLWTVSHSIPPTAESTVRVIMAMLPGQTAVAVVASADGRAFVQRPMGGVSVIEFVGDRGSLPISVEARDENGDVLASDTFNGQTPSKGFYDD